MTFAVRMLVPAVPLASLILAGAAHAETSASAKVGVEGGYGSNPYLDASSSATGSITTRVVPTVLINGPTSTLSLSGSVEHVIFSQLYPDMTNWSLASGLSYKLSPRETLTANASYSSQVQNAQSSALIPQLPGEIPPIDPSAGELGGRRVLNFNAQAGLTSNISTRDSLSVSAFVGKVDYDTVTVDDYSYSSYGGSLGIDHALNARTTLGVSLSYSKSDYASALFGSTQQISPSANASLKLSPRLTFNASAGVSISRIDQGGGSINQTHFSGEANLCYTGLRSTLCASASRSVGSTARAGNSTITSLSGNYSYKLTPRSSFTLSGQYSESQGLTGVTGNVNYGYALFSAGYQRELGRRLSLSVSARYTQPFKSIGGRKKGFYGGVGVNYRLGR